MGITTSVAMAAAAASTAMQVTSQIRAGKEAKQYGEYQANLASIQGTQDLAAASNNAANQSKAKDFALSRAQALAAASGGGATDPTVVKQEQDIAGQGTFNQLMAIYNGQEQQYGETLKGQGDAAQGNEAQKAGMFKAAGTLVGGGASLYEKYGFDQPDVSSDPAVTEGANGVKTYAQDGSLPWQTKGGVANPYYYG